MSSSSISSSWISGRDTELPGLHSVWPCENSLELLAGQGEQALQTPCLSIVSCAELVPTLAFLRDAALANGLGSPYNPFLLNSIITSGSNKSVFPVLDPEIGCS